MTKRKHVLDMQRPGRAISAELRRLLRCPLCVSKEGELVKKDGPYRPHHDRTREVEGLTARMKCETCGLAFSARVEDVARAWKRNTEREEIRYTAEYPAEMAKWLAYMGDRADAAWIEKRRQAHERRSEDFRSLKRSADELEIAASFRPSDSREIRLAKVARYRHDTDAARDARRSHREESRRVQREYDEGIRMLAAEAIHEKLAREE